MVSTTPDDEGRSQPGTGRSIGDKLREQTATRRTVSTIGGEREETGDDADDTTRVSTTGGRENKCRRQRYQRRDHSTIECTTQLTAEVRVCQTRTDDPTELRGRQRSDKAEAEGVGRSNVDRDTTKGGEGDHERI